MCHSWAEGGLDIKPKRLIDEALSLKLSWDLTATDSQWSLLFKERYVSNGQSVMHFVKSSIWSGIKLHIGTVLTNSLWIIGTSENIHLWIDNWLNERLVDLLPTDPHIHGEYCGTVSEVIVNGS